MARKFSRLTRTAIRGLTEPDRQISEHGITFKRLANGDGRYSINVMVDGSESIELLGLRAMGQPALRQRRSSNLPAPTQELIGSVYPEEGKPLFDSIRLRSST